MTWTACFVMQDDVGIVPEIHNRVGVCTSTPAEVSRLVPCLKHIAPGRELWLELLPDLLPLRIGASEGHGTGRKHVVRLDQSNC